ncbi:hypothetical protein [Streptomyces sp. NPDC055709]
MGSLCGICIGTKKIWCPDCFGFTGCTTCKESFKVACPQCSGGEREPILRY